MKELPAGSVLVDAGPLVAVLGRDEAAHRACMDAMESLGGKLLTCWPVIAEAAYLLRRDAKAHDGMLEWVETGVIELIELAPPDISRIREILRQYASLNSQFADACLVHLAEREGIDTIFTLHRRDFSVYRTKRGKGFHLLPEVT